MPACPPVLGPFAQRPQSQRWATVSAVTIVTLISLCLLPTSTGSYRTAPSSRTAAQAATRGNQCTCHTQGFEISDRRSRSQDCDLGPCDLNCRFESTHQSGDSKYAERRACRLTGCHFYEALSKRVCGCEPEHLAASAATAASTM